MHPYLEKARPTSLAAAAPAGPDAIGVRVPPGFGLTATRPAWRRPHAVLPLIAVVAALAVSTCVSASRQPVAPRLYPQFLKAALALSVMAAGLASARPRLAGFYLDRAPLLAGAFLVIAAWQLITDKFGWLPLPYFPGPDAVLQSLVDDRQLLLESTLHSLALLCCGYFLGLVCGLTSGVMIGWFRRVRYWGMPILKVVGPVPATAWIPLAMALSPSTFLSGVGIIALAVWFPVTMLTASGISNVHLAYLDVARTLGAGRVYLVFRVAIPSALPTMFLGCFMGLGAAFLTLVVAEMLGVKSGLGWYMSWAREFSEYSKVYAALFITAIFFSTIMSLLFLLRDRVLRWQKGVIKW